MRMHSVAVGPGRAPARTGRRQLRPGTINRHSAATADHVPV